MFELFDPKADVRITGGASLPHWYQPGVTYFVTFRTEDSIPLNVAKRWYSARDRWLKQRGIDCSAPGWRDRFDELPRAQRKQFHETFSRQYLECLDQGWGACVLRQPELSAIVAQSLLHFDRERYYMGDFVVMPNHVHALVCLIGAADILEQCYSWKKFSASQINKTLGSSGRFWQEESFDHLVRSTNQLQALQSYVASNPKQLCRGEYFLYQAI
jgi:hypothetical protein